jgi:hypothetical protein
MVRLPLTPSDVERGQRLGALLRQARGERSMLEVAIDAGVSPETLRKIETGRCRDTGVPDDRRDRRRSRALARHGVGRDQPAGIGPAPGVRLTP